ncbi:MAG: S8 family serine peptidase, partial [Lachnospiraceae bacterium]|nr:S8 family serine peptidase [Lachnospiraceae bacterium]
MEDQKMENLLNLAVDATPEEREKSLDLETGYDPQEKTWEVIVRYSGSLEEVFALGIRGEELLGGYGILWVPQSLLPAVSNFPQIEYMEKPKRLFFAVNQAKAASCFAGVQEGGLGLSGAGVLVGILDSGIDYFHRDFRNEDGSTRILFLWDQVLEQIYDEAQINEALNAPARGEGQVTVPSVDVSGHGTAVAGIAAGNGRDSGGLYRGAAYGSSLIVVKLGTAQAEGFPRTTQLMRALDFVLKKAVELGRPIAVNISIGNTYGSHDGTSLLETFMDEAAGFGRNVIVVGSGNEGGSAGHASGVLSEGRQAEILVSVAPYETSLSVQLWKAYADQFRVTLVAPSGEQLGPFSETLGPQRYRYRSAQGETRILVYYGKPSPYSRFQEIYLDFIPEQTYIGSGIWRILLEPVKILSGQ